MQPTTFQRVLRWTALITGSVLLAFLVWMLIGHLTGNANGPNGMTFHSEKEVLAFVLFPLCTIIGLALAYKWELLGGLIAVGSIGMLLTLRSDLAQGYFLALSAPGLLYCFSGWMSRKRS